MATGRANTVLNLVERLRRRPLLAAVFFLLLLPDSATAGFDEGIAAYERGDYATALRELRPLAIAGTPRPQFAVGVMYERGWSVAENDAEAVRWYRSAADQGLAKAQFNLGLMYGKGKGVPQDYAEALRWQRRAAEQGHAKAQFNLGEMYYFGEGIAQNYTEAVRWYRLAANHGDVDAQFSLGAIYDNGRGVVQNHAEAAHWFRLAAEQGHTRAQYNIGDMYDIGMGLPQDSVLAYMWFNLAAAGSSQGEERERSVEMRDKLAARLSPVERARGQELARNWQPRVAASSESESSDRWWNEAPLLSDEEVFGAATQRRLDSTGTGFAVSQDGHLLTNHHVVANCAEVRIRPPGQEVAAGVVIARDPGNDLALLRAPTRLPAAVLRADRGIRAGDSVVAVGFPLHGLLASEANVTTGTVSALAGVGNDTRFLQMTVPVQPGNSGGPLLDLEGRVVGVVVGKLDALKVASVTGDIPQNVNFAIKAEVVQTFLNASGVPPRGAVADRGDPPADAAYPVPHSPATVGAEAKAFTVRVECWK